MLSLSAKEKTTKTSTKSKITRLFSIAFLLIRNKNRCKIIGKRLYRTFFVLFKHGILFGHKLQNAFFAQVLLG